MQANSTIALYKGSSKILDESIDNITTSKADLKHHIIVTATIKKTKISKKNKKPLGFEFDIDVLNDNDLCNKILATRSYVATSDKFIDYAQELARLMDIVETEDRRNVGTILGMTVLGVVGFLAFSFTIVGGICGGVIGIGLGRYAGKKIKRRVKHKKPLTGEEMYKIKLQVMVKWGEISARELQLNINDYRMILEKIIEEFAPALDLEVFTNGKMIKKSILKLRKFLLKVWNQRTIILSYKLFVAYLKHVNVDEPQAQLEIAHKVHHLFLPLKIILEMSTKATNVVDSKIRGLVSYQKICKLINNNYVQNALRRYPNPLNSAETKLAFKSSLQDQVDIGKRMTDYSQDHKAMLLATLEQTRADTNTKSTKANVKTDHNKENEIMNMNTLPDINFTEECDEKIAHRYSPYLFKFNENQVSTDKKDSKPYKHSYVLDVQKKTMKMSESLEQMQEKYKTPPQFDSVHSSEVSSLEDKEPESDLLNDPALYNGPKLQECKVQLPKGEDPMDLENIECTPYRKEKAKEISTGANTRKHAQSVTTFKSEFVTLSLLPNQPSIPRVTNDMAEIASYNERMLTKKHSMNCRDLIKMPSDSNLQTIQNESEKRSDDITPSTRRRAECVDDSKANAQVNNDVNKDITKMKQVSSPMNSKKMETQVFQKILSIDNDNYGKWEKVLDQKIMRIFKIKPEDSPVVLIRGIAFCEGLRPKQIFDVIYDSAYRQKWDSVVSNFQVVEKIDDYTDIIYFLIKAPFGASNRDFLQQRRFRMNYPEKGHIMISFQSTTHHSVPPQKSAIRGETVISGYIIRPAPHDPNSSELVIISQVDIKGAIPKTIVNYVASKAPLDWVNKMMKASKERPIA
jgi:hypothetical protein